MKQFWTNLSEFWKTISTRWKNAMPKFFNRVCWVCSLISGSVAAANTAMQAMGIQPHEWFTDLLPYLIGFPAGIAFAAKFTQQYTGKPVNYKEVIEDAKSGTRLADGQSPNMSDVDTSTYSE